MAARSIELLAEAGLDCIPNEWDVVTIGQLLSKDKGIAVGVMYPGDHDPLGIPLIRSGDLNGNRINPNPDFRISSEKHIEYKRTALEGGELLLSLVGNLGQCEVVPVSMAGWNVARAVAVIRLANKSDVEFVRLCLISKPLQYLMNAWATTTVQATLNLKEIKELPIPWPSKIERDAWVTTINALDDKIELNRRMNQTLECMARAVFRQWFVENEDGENWEAAVLNDLADSVLGGDWGKDINEDAELSPAYCIRGADIPDLQSGGMGKMPLRYLIPSSLEKRRLRAGDIVVEISGGSPTQSTGRPVFISNTLLRRLQYPLVAPNFCRVFRPKDTITDLSLKFLVK